jgi:enoyl-CoA hydratase/3-hydroxyacyl-CoA dehydrogenase
MRLGTAFPLGPLALADALGIDKVLQVLRGSTRYTPAKILETMAARGDLGEKSGRGFYEHTKPEGGTTYETIIVSKDAETKTATITLNRPDRLNTLVPQLVDELERALMEIEKDEAVRCLVVTGAGEKAFSAGADLTTFGDVGKSYRVWRSSRRTQEVFSRLANFPRPTVAAIQGYALGGGCELALACDFRLAAKRAQIGQTEITLGLIPGAGGIPRLVKLLGLARAKELVLLGPRLSADEALDIGLVTRVFENEAFVAGVKEFATKLANGPPIAMRLAKHVLNRAGDIPLDAALEAEAMAFGHVTSTEDIFEGIQAFMEKREPKFKGE